MAKKKKYYNRNYMKQHYATKTFISNDGLHVERDFFNKEKNQLETYNPSIHEDKYGRRFIRFNSYGDIFIAEMVISCYCAPKPKDGKEYEIEHIDATVLQPRSAEEKVKESDLRLRSVRNLLMYFTSSTNQVSGYTNGTTSALSTP